MKHIKTYENIFTKLKQKLSKHVPVEPEREPQEGDYVILEINGPTLLGIKMMNTIGRIDKVDEYGYHIYYTFDDGSTHKSLSNKRIVIKYFSPNKEDMEAVLASKKYNL